MRATKMVIQVISFAVCRKRNPKVFSRYHIYIRGGGGTPLYGLYKYVRRQRVWFFSRIGYQF